MVSFHSIDSFPPHYWWFPSIVLMVSLHSTDGILSKYCWHPYRVLLISLHITYGIPPLYWIPFWCTGYWGGLILGHWICFIRVLSFADYVPQILKTLACVVPFLSAKTLNTLPAKIASSIVNIPYHYHSAAINLISGYLLPLLLGNYSIVNFNSVINLTLIFLTLRGKSGKSKV